MFGVFPILLRHYAKKVCPHFSLSAYEWAWETQTYSLNKSLNTNKLYLLLTLKDQRTTWRNPKDRFALDSALQTKQDMHEINTPLSWSKSLVKPAHHPKPKSFSSNSIRTSTEKNYTTVAFCWHRFCLTQPTAFSWARKNVTFWGNHGFEEFSDVSASLGILTAQIKKQKASYSS